MNIGLINGSPKAKGNSSSEILLDDLNSLFPIGHSVQRLHFNKPAVTDQDIEKLQHCQAWVFAFPLYVDGIPSHLLSCLKQLEQADFKGKDIRVYVIINCGFYEAGQNRHAMEMMEIWCEKTGIKWGMGIGLGGGGGLLQMRNVPLGKGPKTTLGKSLLVFCEAVLNKESKDTHYISINFPRFVYKFIANNGWNKLIKENGGKVKDLKRRY